MKLTRLFLGLTALVLAGCATQHSIQIDAIAEPQPTNVGKRYVLSNANPDTRDDDLFFREFSGYFHKALAERGYQRAASPDEADIEVHFKYGVSGGRTGVHTYTWPIYDMVGGDTITIRETTTDSSGNPVTTTRTINIPARFERIGTALEARNYTEFTRFVQLEARTLPHDKSAGRPVWKVMISSVGETDDLRSVIPWMALAAAPYLGTNTGGKTTVRLSGDDPRIAPLRAAP